MGITRTVGSGRDHATLQSALDYFNNYDFSSNSGGLCYIDIYPEGGGTDGEWTVSTSLDGPTGTTNATVANHLVIRAAVGYSFKDHANKLTNALRYNPANGVAIRATETVTLFNSRADYLEISGLQMKSPHWQAAVLYMYGTHTTVRNNIFSGTRASSNACIGIVNQSFGVFNIINNLLHECSLDIATNGSDVIVGNTVVNNSDDSRDIGAIKFRYGQGIIADNIAYANGAVNDFQFASGATPATGSGYNAANDTSSNTTGMTTGAVQSVTMSDIFESVTAGSEDYRIKASAASSIKTGGTRKQSDTSDFDIIGQSRSTTTPTIGAWEYISANVFALGTPGTVAAHGYATLSGDPDAFTKYWRIPSNAAPGTTGRMIVFASGNPPTTVAYEGAVTADASGYFSLLTSDASAGGTKRFAIVHAWNGVTGTTSIYGGPGISELILV